MKMKDLKRMVNMTASIMSNKLDFISLDKKISKN